MFDTNVLIRPASHPHGFAAALIAAAAAAPHVIVSSAYILDEVRRVLGYPRVRSLHCLDDREIDDYVNRIESVSQLIFVDPISVPLVTSADPADDPVLATAVKAGQTYSALSTVIFNAMMCESIWNNTGFDC